MTGRHVRAFGVDLALEPALPGAWATRTPRQPPVRVMICGPADVASAWSGEAAPGWQARLGDGERFRCTRGCAGDHRFAYGARATFHLSEDGSLLRCAPEDPHDLAWQRVLLDSVLVSVALLHGHEALHAAAVDTAAGVLAVTALSGGGKSTLCSELVRRGHGLVADDVVALSGDDGTVVAHPGPPVMNLPPERVGTVGRHITTFSDDAWVEEPVIARCRPLAAVVFLTREGTAPVRCTRVAAPALRLMPALLRFPLTRERERARFRLACDIADRVPVYELSAGLGATPDQLADELEGVGAGELAA